MTKDILFIEGRRNGYHPSQCGKTMTIGELIRFLSNYDEDREVFLRNDNGYTYGNITEDSITDDENEEDDL